MFTADAHCDTLYAVGVNGTDINSLTVTPERLKAGSVGLQTFAMFAGSKGMQDNPLQKGLKMLAAIDSFPVPILRGALPEQPPETPMGILSIEGGEMLEGSLDVLCEIQQKCRLHMIALTWNHENEIGHPASDGPTGGLTAFGKSLLREMDAQGILADVSHLNEAGFWDICEGMNLPPIATHSNYRPLCETTRNLTREQTTAIIEKNGFIGINFYAEFLRTDSKATLEDVLRHIDAIAELGGIGVLGFGSDFDGIDAWPDGLSNPADFPNLLELLLRHGYSEAEVAGIAGLNLWNLLKRCEAQAIR